MVSVSFLKSKLSTKDTIKKIDESDADFIHVDLMDGHYVSEKNFELDTILELLNNTNKELDVHLMVNDPINYIEKLAKLSVAIITIHLNINSNIEDTINLIKKYNIKAGIAINPDEDIHLLDKYLNIIDYVLIMSVYPGAGGQVFIKDVLSKIKYLENKYLLIGIDGGINAETIYFLKDYKIDNIVSGSFICMSDDYNEKINYLKKAIEIK